MLGEMTPGVCELYCTVITTDKTQHSMYSLYWSERDDVTLSTTVLRYRIKEKNNEQRCIYLFLMLDEIIMPG